MFIINYWVIFLVDGDLRFVWIIKRDFFLKINLRYIWEELKKLKLDLKYFNFKNRGKFWGENIVLLCWGIKWSLYFYLERKERMKKEKKKKIWGEGIF